MSLNTFLQRLNDAPDSICFTETMALIEELYDFTPTAFKNGATSNEAGQNNGSCKLFSFAKLNKLSPQQTLTCFGDYYRKDVLGNPDGADHANIRNFMQSGWEGVAFESDALTPKGA
ncbi:MAG: HopJ type III effector protein [Gammaproteobacteria bacterium]|nr:HopJ type III effector protein [Gammaproteobacteria bacterium]MBU1625604.1 HopJ type III effector protein [Gammaproteobacteria bacterium]MBU1980864.1 HopJ type III effector protein [Gammaproteobacteria bacterium]